MIRIGAFAAKTHLSELLERAERGERIIITRRGKAVAMLGPPVDRAARTSNVVEEMLRARDEAGPKLGAKLTVRQLREEGRRF